MPSEDDFDALVAPLREDNVSGASELSRTAADVVRRAAVRLPAGSTDELQWSLVEICHRILDAQPSMATMVTLSRRVLESVDAEDSLQEGRQAAVRAAEEFRDGLEPRARAVVHSATRILPDGGTVATISASGTVRRLLMSEAAPREIRVLCFESRPMSEGRALAEALAGAGVDVRYAVDAAIEALAGEIDVVVVGADSIGDAGAVNKIGSRSLARAARTTGAPVYVLADETKLLPRGHPQIVDDDRPAEEVWDGAPEAVSVWNRYFEVVPRELVTGVATEDGVLTPAQLEDVRSRLELPAGIRAWATSRVQS